jgi:multidrug transporter EmrE-like cation transporter
VPNYLSLYFLLKVLVTTGWESTIVFPLANIGVVVTSAIVGILVFKEKLSKINVIGIVVAVFAIGLIIAATNG